MIAIRAARAEDAAAIAAIYNRYVTQSAVSFETDPLPVDDMRARMEAGGGAYPWLVATENNEVAGYAYASAFRPRAAYRFAVEVTVYLHPDRVGKGIGRRLYATLLPILERQGFTQAIAAITLPNDRSVRLHEEMSFQAAGVYRAVGYKLGRWHDVGLWQRALAAADGEPAEPRPLAGIGIMDDA